MLQFCMSATKPQKLLPTSIQKMSSCLIYILIYKISLRNIKVHVSHLKMSLIYWIKQVYIYPTPQPWAGCDTRSIFKQSIAYLKSEFSSSSTGCLIKAEFFCLSEAVYLLCFDLLTQPKMPFKVTHQKEVTHSNGSYERKSRGQKLADEMGQGKK